MGEARHVEEFQLENLMVLRFPQGQTQTNAYLVGVQDGETAAVIDPAWDGREIHQEARARGWVITNIWLTHAHFDHFAGAAELDGLSEVPIPIALHPDDHPLWRVQGGAQFFGMPDFDPGPEPTVALREGMVLRLGPTSFHVHHTPGHSPGHTVIADHRERGVFVGDLIFQGSVGRTDLPGASWEALMASIETFILPLPDATLLFPGHGPVTTVGDERRANPFLSQLGG